MRKRLRSERIRMRLSQAEMAEYLGITQPAYSMVESGTRAGRKDLWEDLERLFRVDQKVLKENSEDNNGIRSVGRNAGV